jgi:hypothetical protein
MSIQQIQPQMKLKSFDEMTDEQVEAAIESLVPSLKHGRKLLDDRAKYCIK